MTRVGRSDGGAANHRERAMASRPMIGTTSSAITADWRDFLALTKPRVMTLLVFTGLSGLLAAPVSHHPGLAFAALLCIALGAGPAGSLNQWYEDDLDAKMQRHARRPLPVGRMERQSGTQSAVWR